MCLEAASRPFTSRPRDLQERGTTARLDFANSPPRRAGSQSPGHIANIEAREGACGKGDAARLYFGISPPRRAYSQGPGILKERKGTPGTETYRSAGFWNLGAQTCLELEPRLSRRGGSLQERRVLLGWILELRRPSVHRAREQVSYKSRPRPSGPET